MDVLQFLDLVRIVWKLVEVLTKLQVFEQLQKCRISLFSNSENLVVLRGHKFSLVELLVDCFHTCGN